MNFLLNACIQHIPQVLEVLELPMVKAHMPTTRPSAHFSQHLSNVKYLHSTQKSVLFTANRKWAVYGGQILPCPECLCTDNSVLGVLYHGWMTSSRWVKEMKNVLNPSDVFFCFFPAFPMQEDMQVVQKIPWFIFYNCRVIFQTVASIVWRQCLHQLIHFRNFTGLSH